MPLIEAGKKAPAFTLADQRGEKHALKDYAHGGRGASPVVLYFYPKDDTSGCTKEARQFRDSAAEFGDLGAIILGVSPDSEESHAKFADKHSLNYTLLADPGAKVCDKYGVWREKSMYGNKYMGVVRTTYLIAPTGKVAQRWDRVKVPGHADAVLRALRDL